MTKKQVKKKQTKKSKPVKKGKANNGIDIGGTVRHYRKSIGMTTTKLAQKAKISQAQVSRLENNQQGFRSGTLCRVAKALKVPPWALFMTADERGRAEKALGFGG